MKSYSAEYIQQLLDGEENPFWTLEALGEQANACWGALAKMGIEVIDPTPEGQRQALRPRGNPGEIIYHLRAVEEYQKKLWNAFAALLPDILDFSDGESHQAFHETRRSA